MEKNLFVKKSGNIIKTRKNAIVKYLDYQIPVTHLKGPKGNRDMQAANRDLNTPPTGGRQIKALWALEWAWQNFFWINR